MRVHMADESHVAVIDERPSGVGTTVWVGELRTLANDEPVRAWAIAPHLHQPTDRRRRHQGVPSR